MMHKTASLHGYSKIMGNQTIFIYGIGFFVLIALALVATVLGPVDIHFLNDLFRNDEPVQNYILWQVRLPRILFSMVIGASLGLAGALTQGLFRNPLADPGLLGVSSGAAAAAAAAIVFSGVFGYCPALLSVAHLVFALH
jgi:iron complex transport system permease protein